MHRTNGATASPQQYQPSLPLYTIPKEPTSNTSTPLALRDSKAPLIKKNCALGIQAGDTPDVSDTSLPLLLSLTLTLSITFIVTLSLFIFILFKLNLFPSCCRNSQ